MRNLIRCIDPLDIYKVLKPALLEMNRSLPEDVLSALHQASENCQNQNKNQKNQKRGNRGNRGQSSQQYSYKPDLGSTVLARIIENCKISAIEKLPLCQDTGLLVVFVDIGADVVINYRDNTKILDKELENESSTNFEARNVDREGFGCGDDDDDDDDDGDRASSRASVTYPDNYDPLETVIKQSAADAWEEGYFRASVVGDPLKDRENTKTNLPPVIHYRRVPGNSLTISCLAKGFGSENWSKTFMLKPTEGREGVVNAVIKAMELAGGSPCPPVVLGVGIGGTMEYAALLSKRALLRKLDDHNADPYYKELEDELLFRVNSLPIGPGGLAQEESSQEEAPPKEALSPKLPKLKMHSYCTALAVKVEHYPTHIAGLPVAVSVNCWADRKCILEI